MWVRVGAGVAWWSALSVVAGCGGGGGGAGFEPEWLATCDADCGDGGICLTLDGTKSCAEPPTECGAVLDGCNAADADDACIAAFCGDADSQSLECFESEGSLWWSVDCDTTFSTF